MKDFRDLNVWRKSHEIAVDVYSVTKSFPSEELYALTSQMRRSAVSIAANIAEGCGRSSDADFARFVVIALGSASEFEYQLLLARDLGFLEPAHYEAMSKKVVEVKRMLAGLVRKLKADG